MPSLGTRIVYVDYDPVAIAHSWSLLSHTDKATAIQADMRRPDDILTNPAVTSLIDFTQPVAVLLLAMLHLLPDDQNPAAIVARFREVMAPGSYLVLSHITSHQQPPEVVTNLKRAFSRAREPMVPRSREEILSFLEGFDLVDPGLVKAPTGDPTKQRRPGSPRPASSWPASATSAEPTGRPALRSFPSIVASEGVWRQIASGRDALWRPAPVGRYRVTSSIPYMPMVSLRWRPARRAAGRSGVLTNAGVGGQSRSRGRRSHATAGRHRG
jgi:hypothetical protein